MADVIQGSFPHGLPRVAPAQTAQPFSGHATPAWVQARIGHHAPQPQTVQRHAAPAHPNAMPLPQHVAPLPRHGGQPLPLPVLQRMEAAFGVKFGDVRVHTTPQVQTLGASAVTQGTHIHFAPGKYDPHTHQGRQLLGRELAHVVQQRAGRVRNPFGTGTAIVQDRMLEEEAERMAVRAAAVQRAVRPVIQRLKRITDMVTNPFERVSRQEMLRRYTFYLLGVAGEYEEEKLLKELLDLYNYLANNSPDTVEATRNVREVLDKAASILRDREQLSIIQTEYQIDYSSFGKEKEKLTHRDFKNKNKNKEEKPLPKFVSLKNDVELGLYMATAVTCKKIQEKEGMGPFKGQSGISVDQAVAEAIEVIDVWDSSNAAYSRHDHQPSKSDNKNLQIQLGGSKLNYRPGKGDSSVTLVVIDMELYKNLRDRDEKRLKLVLQAAHRLSYDNCARVDITPKK